MSKEKACQSCGHFAELKEPFERSDGAVIYGYCFKDGDKDYSTNMGKGYPVFVDGGGGACKQYKRRRAVIREQIGKERNVLTNGDLIRAMTDEALVEKLFQLYQETTEQDCGDISTNWCDNKGECVNCGEFFACDDERHKACILRWLRSAAKEQPT